MKKKNGFTLVELLITIILLTVVGGILIFSMTNINKSNKEKDYEKFVNMVTSAASVYANLNPEVFSDLYINKAFMYITVGDLIAAGELDENLVNPYTNEKIGPEELIKVDLDAEGNLEYIYPFNKDDMKDIFLVAQSDYVVYGEPYDCMRGVGTYELMLSDMDGNFITADGATEEEKIANTKKMYIDNYSFSCEMPESFEPVAGFEKYGVGTKVAGSYDVVYHWITENGVKKTMKRVLKVMPKIEGEIRFKVAPANTHYNELNGNNFNKYVPTNNGETYLKYYPYVEGVDKETTSYTITAGVHMQEHGPNVHTSEVVEKGVIFPDETGYTESWPGKIKTIATNSNDWNKDYAAFDGKIDYNIKIKVNGHYVPGYTYTSKQTYSAEQDLVINKVTIPNSTVYSNVKTATITEPYNKVGIDHYEYYLSNNDVVPTPDTPGMRFENGSNSVTVNLKEGSIINGQKISCGSSKLINYAYIYFRAVNKNGYVGSWSQRYDFYLTNNLSELLQAGPCGHRSYSGSLAGLYCNYTTDSTYVKLVSQNGTSKTCSALGVYPSVNNRKNAMLSCSAAESTSLVSVHTGSATIRFCDGSFTAYYNYSRASYNNFKSSLDRFVNTMPTLYDGTSAANGYVKLHTWYADFPYVRGYPYTGYAGMPTVTERGIFGGALGSGNYWLAQSYRSNVSRYFKGSGGGGTVNYSNEYMYAFVNGSVTSVSNGASYPVKPMIIIDQMIACGGNGSASDPYKVTNVSE